MTTRKPSASAGKNTRAPRTRKPGREGAVRGEGTNDTSRSPAEGAAPASGSTQGAQPRRQSGSGTGGAGGGMNSGPGGAAGSSLPDASDTPKRKDVRGNR